MSLAVARPVRVWLEHDEQLLRVRLSQPKANIIDGATIAALWGALDAHADRSNLLGVLIDAEGPNFSFGASVEEHLPDRCALMLRRLHALILCLVEYPAPVLVAVRGQCLGGGLELACAGSLIFASPESFFGQPEIKLGVFAPAASCLLPQHIGRAAAEAMLFSGRSIPAQEAHRLGLVQMIAEDPEAAALAWFEQNLAERSGAALRHALRAARLEYVEMLRRDLRRVEALYLGELMSTHDAIEGLDAFLAKRPARWEHR